MTEYRWNRVGLTTPTTWEPSALERDGFLLECEGQPVCELKWKTIQGRFSFEKHIKKLSKGHKNVAIHAVESKDAPEPWRNSVSALEHSGIEVHTFIWSLHDLKGMGAAVHNPATGLAVLIQFFLTSDSSTHTASIVLASFKDFSGGKTTPWAMFGLEARIPSSFALNTFSFKPGYYSVLYWLPKSGKQSDRTPPGKGPGLSLSFERYAPASVLLKETNLMEWIHENLDPTFPKQLVIKKSAEEVAWQGVAKTSMLRNLFGRSVYEQGRVWTTDTGNAILCVRASGHIDMPEITFKTICESYAVV
jgi:hypothetical protein